MITISRNISETSTPDKFIYTTLYLYSDVSDVLIDAMSAGDFELSTLPVAVVDFILSYYGVENGLRHLVTKSVVDGDYVRAVSEVTIPHHYVCCDSKDLSVSTEISNSILDDKKLFVTYLPEAVAIQMPPNKNTYILYEENPPENIWLWDNSNAYWSRNTPIGIENA